MTTDLIKSSFNILFWLAFVLVVILLQASRLFALGGVNPNLLILVLASVLVWQGSYFKKLIFVWSAILVCSLVFPVWLAEFLILGGLISAAGAARKFLFDKPFWDFLILVFGVSLLFYLFSDFGHLFRSGWQVLKEGVYNVSLAVLLSVLF